VRRGGGEQRRSTRVGDKRRKERKKERERVSEREEVEEEKIPAYLVNYLLITNILSARARDRCLSLIAK
jgi:hypothetical protein